MASEIPNNLKYTKDHEWALIENDVVTVGITDFAQSQLGDVVFVELPEVGTELNHGDSFGVVESIKSVSDLYSPVSGEVIEKNDDLEASPENCNSTPYESWMVKIKLSNNDGMDELMSAEDYSPLCEE
ncbi:MAG: glycine cleavage system protein H [Halobacteriovoraceae bacterium]|jgi:glycine cleavage system H protein|nr:glycine cleavage system protein H [Halobacteriovoraceae bacterium]|tara:strand:+ start:616 stop:999 length:384 start_codon:yes stop_codon:yes gene_type:complete